MVNVIVGNGITGKIISHFLSNSVCIGMPTINTPPIFYLWDTLYTRKFCENFKYPYSVKPITVNFVHSGDLDEAIKIYNKLTSKPVDSKPSMGKRNFDSLILEKEIELRSYPIEGKVKEIDTKAKTLTYVTGDLLDTNLSSLNLTMNYDKIYWCCGYDGLVLDNIKLVQKLSRIWVFTVKTSKKLHDSDYLYCLDKKYLDMGVYRSCKISDNLYSFECAGGETHWKQFEEMLKKDLDDTASVVKIESKNGQCIKSDPLENENIIKFGRYAEDNNEIKVNDVIEKAIKTMSRWKCDEQIEVANRKE